MKKLNKITLLPLLVLPFTLSSCNYDVYITAKYFDKEDKGFSLKLTYNYGFVFTEESISEAERILFNNTPNSVRNTSECSCYFSFEGMYLNKEFTSRIEPGYKLTKNITVYYHILG
jgi:hypothetical protein